MRATSQGLRAHLKQHPKLVHQRVVFEGGNYFRNPTLLEFVAENPVRHGTLPPTSSKWPRSFSMRAWNDPH